MLFRSIIELAGLPDDDGAAADEHDFFEVLTLGHASPVRLNFEKGKTGEKVTMGTILRNVFQPEFAA